MKAYVWLIMDKVSHSILGYQVSTSRDVGPCILTMRMAFDKFNEFPSKALKFIADGYSTCPLAAQQFRIEKDWEVFITQVRSPTASLVDMVQKMALTTVFHFGLPEISCRKEPLNKVELLENVSNMPGKWQLLIYLGQQTILKQQKGESAICS